MKKNKIKLSLSKETVSNLNNIIGGAKATALNCVPPSWYDACASRLCPSRACQTNAPGQSVAICAC